MALVVLEDVDVESNDAVLLTLVVAVEDAVVDVVE